jgi:hypothetical protein
MARAFSTNVIPALAFISLALRDIGRISAPSGLVENGYFIK